MSDDFFNSDMRFFLENRIDWPRYLRLKNGAPVDAAGELEDWHAILRTAADICTEIAPMARAGWHDEVVLEDGVVRVPPHIAKAYDLLKQAGLVCLPVSPRWGGAGSSMFLNSALLEMLSRTDASLMTIVGLQGGAAIDIEKYGSDELRDYWLPRFTSGEVQGSMDLTEPNAGSDLGGILTRVTEEDGRFFIDGSKIFITNGGCDVHLVLARDAATFEQSKGTTNGLCLLLCPRVLRDGQTNGMRVSRVERKMGIHGSPTCAVEFEHAEGFLLGERGNGFRAMLDLMNNARIGVSAQGLGIAEAAFHQARNYARERVQFGQPIIRQPLVKSMLTLMALDIQAARALLYHTCTLVDVCDAIASHLASDREDPEFDRAALQKEYEHNHQLVRFLTPLCKFLATETASEVARKGVQIHGGLGFMAESAAGQYLADSIITTIYEGTSEIQASFALREMAKGALFTLLDDTKIQLGNLRQRFPEQTAQLDCGIEQLGATLPSLLGDPSYALLNAKRVSEMVITIIVGVELLEQATVSPERTVLASAYINRKILEVDMHARRIQSGDVTRLERYDRILGLTD